MSSLLRGGRHQQQQTNKASSLLPVLQCTCHRYHVAASLILCCDRQDGEKLILARRTTPNASGSDQRWLLKRRRATLKPTTVHPLSTTSARRSGSPSKRQRRNLDDLQLKQSGLAVGLNAHPLILASAATFNPPSSRAGTSTPRWAVKGFEISMAANNDATAEWHRFNTSASPGRSSPSQEMTGSQHLYRRGMSNQSRCRPWFPTLQVCRIDQH